LRAPTQDTSGTQEARLRHAKIFLGRIAADPDVLLVALGLERLVDALPVRTEGPAMVRAPDHVTLHPSGAQHYPTMRAPIIDTVDLAFLATINSELLAHDHEGD
jgi:hypothetical protein